ncbi:armadillo-type protein [Cyathus striatus]|nr:armadillo-type protein [Cyathus striatus]
MLFVITGWEESVKTLATARLKLELNNENMRHRMTAVRNEDKNSEVKLEAFVRVKYLMQNQNGRSLVEKTDFQEGVSVLTKILIDPQNWVLLYTWYILRRAVDSLVQLNFNPQNTFSFLKNADETIWVIWVWALQRLIEDSSSTTTSENLQELMKPVFCNIRIPGDTHPQVRMEWVDLLTLIAEKEIHNPIHVIWTMATEDSNENVRTKAVQSLASLLNKNTLIDKLDETFKAFLSAVAVPEKSGWELRLEYVKLFSILTQNHIRNSLQAIVNMAREDNDRDVRAEAVKSLVNILKSNVNLTEADKLMLSDITIPLATWRYGWQVRREWVKFFTTLTDKGIYDALPKIIDMALEDADEDVRADAVQSVTSLIDTVNTDRNLEEVLKSMLSKALMSETELDYHWRVRREWVKLFTILTKKRLPNLLPIIAEMAREDRDEDVRSDAVQSLLSLVDTYDTLLEADKALLSKISMAVTTDPEQQVWSKWIRLFTTMAQKNLMDSSLTIIKMAREDADKDVRVEAVQSLITLVYLIRETHESRQLN